MEIPRQAEQARSLLHRAMKAVPIGTATAGAVPDAPTDGSDPATQTTEKWRDGELGFLNEQLGDPKRMSLYNAHLIIKTLRRVALAATLAALGGTEYMMREPNAGVGKVTLVVAAWVISIIAVVGMTVLSFPRWGSAKKTLSEPEREVEQTSNAKAGEDGDQSGHHAPDQQ